MDEWGAVRIVCEMLWKGSAPTFVTLLSCDFLLIPDSVVEGFAAEYRMSWFHIKEIY